MATSMDAVRIAIQKFFSIFSWPLKTRLLHIPVAVGCLMLFLPAQGRRSESPLVRFEIWGTYSDSEGAPGKFTLYLGWVNGFLQAKGSSGEKLGRCLGEIGWGQASAMIDKWYRGHPEKWSEPLGKEILAALTVNGGPCSGLSSRSN